MGLRNYILYLKYKRHWGLWRYFPWLGTTIVVPWPRGVNSTDPNEIMRPWLEENAGKQGWTWSWDIVVRSDTEDGLELKFLNKNHAIMFKMIYG